VSYSLSILRRAQKELAQIPRGGYERVVEAIRDLAKNPRPTGCRKLALARGGGFASATSESSMKSTMDSAR